jgi:hypothetical protein
LRLTRCINAERDGVVINAFDEGETVMRGPTILARSMSIATRRGKSPRAWQYHSRSDSHSKIACWTLLFDLLLECDAVRDIAARGRLGFRINHMMVGSINKTLDLVLTIVQSSRHAGARRTFAELAGVLGVSLDDADLAALDGLPFFYEEHADDVSEVAVAVEAKACMTEHVKSLPRLHAEILATGYLAKLAAPHCLSVSYSLVNAAATFVSPSGKGAVNRHSQPEDARRVVQMISNAVPAASKNNQYGYDVIGTTVVDCRNDGSPVTVMQADPAPTRNDHTHYERMLVSLCGKFRERRF